MIALAIGLFLIPSVAGWQDGSDAQRVVDLSVPVAIALLVVYAGVTAYTLRRHHAVQVASDDEIEAWSFPRSLAALGIATVVTALVAEILVGSLESFADQAGLSDFFVAAVIVAIVGNAAEHGGAVIVAHRGKIKLAAEIALSSSAQVAVFLIPAVVLFSWLIDPLALGFRKVEIRALALSLAVVMVTIWSGVSSRFRGRRPRRGLRRRRGDVLRRRDGRPAVSTGGEASCEPHWQSECVAQRSLPSASTHAERRRPA